jgi:NAD(P)-dependent dehydrogenase (short-subunit alcohol dehydrogenase family)
MMDEQAAGAPKDKGSAAQVAVVTGGRRGIGKACAQALAEAGFDIVVVDLVEDNEATGTLAELRRTGRRAELVIGDIADFDGLRGLADRIVGVFGGIDCLVNNAGVLSNSRGRDLLDATPETFDRVMHVNLRGTFFFTQEISRRMIAMRESTRPWTGSIITITSGAVGSARLDSPEYAFSKTGLSLMSQAFAARLGPHNIRTYEVRPGVIKTEMSRDVWPMYDALIAEGRFPLGRIGLPEDVGKTVAALAGGAIPHSTGDYFHIDGGYHVPVPGAARRPTKTS